jgi:hypothetical protein
MFRDTDPQNAGPVVAVIAASTNSPRVATHHMNTLCEPDSLRSKTNTTVKQGVAMPTHESPTSAFAYTRCLVLLAPTVNVFAPQNIPATAFG